MYAQLTVLNISVIFAKCHDNCKTCEKSVRGIKCVSFLFTNLGKFSSTRKLNK